MQDFGLRILLAAAISLSGIVGTYLWSRSNQVKVVVSGPAPLARIVSSKNEIQKRPDQRLIWQSAFTNQDLYPGEAVRTTTQAEAQIEFLSEDGQSTTVQLDPDSVIEIQKDQSGINIDFLKGSLFVKSTAEGAPKITVQSGSEKIEVTKSEVQLSKAASDAPLDVDVIKGEANLLRDGKVTPPKAKLRLVRPGPEQSFYVDPNIGQLVGFEWEPIDSSYDVTLEVGPTRTTLAPVENLKPVSGRSGKLAVALPVGKHFFRLVAKSTRAKSETLQTSTVRTEVRAKIPPVPIEPASDLAVQALDDKGSVLFKWSNPGALTDLVLEVSKRPDLRDPVIQRLGEKTEERLELKNIPGARYWRVSGRIKDAKITVASKVNKFNLRAFGRPALNAPVLLASQPESVVPALVMKEEGIRLSWQAVTGASGYEVKITYLSSGDRALEAPTSASETSSVYRRATTSNVVSVKSLKPGRYEWRVIAKDEFGDTSPESEIKRFLVDNIAMLAWSDGLTDAKTTFVTVKPVLQIAWERGPGQPKQWRVRVGTERAPASESEWRVVMTPRLSTVLDRPGTYYIEAESIDASGTVIAKTSLRSQEFEQAPPLRAPAFASSMGLEIQANETGGATVVWQPVDGAKEYVLEMKDGSGSTVKTMRLKETRTAFSKLKTGRYKVSLKSVDAIGRIGPEGETRTLRVPEYSDVQAPKLKNIQVR